VQCVGTARESRIGLPGVHGRLIPPATTRHNAVAGRFALPMKKIPCERRVPRVISSQPTELEAEMRLRRSVLSAPGIARKRRGKGFAYYGPGGRPLNDPAAVARIKELVIPPAWKKVWISPHANDHIQAVGTDAAGRRQYLYHFSWQQERAEEKFDRVLEMSTRLPDVRARIATDLAGRGLSRDRVLALACGCSIGATSARAVSNTPRSTSRTGSPPCCASTSRCAKTRSSSTTPARVGCGAPWKSRTRKWSVPCVH
jgi:hypothetical protein